MDGSVGPVPLKKAEDGRRDARRRVLFGGKLLYGDDDLTLDCAIRNLSSVGAKIRLASPVVLPSEVRLIELRAGVVFDCRVIWRRAPEYGLELLGSRDLSKGDEPELRVAKRIWIEHAAR